MKYVKQLFIILAISLMSELLQNILPLPIPSGIYGMIILFTLLSCNLLKEEHIRETADFLLGILGLILIPICVGIMDTFSHMQAILPALLVVTTLGTTIVIIVTGLVAQVIIHRKEGK